MKKLILLLSALGSIAASAQTTGEMLLFSQNNFGISTARSAAMGGAFTSLGADAASMSINPAGLGLYRMGEVSFTPQFRMVNTINGNYAPWSSMKLSEETNNRTNKAVIGSIGAVIVSGNFSYGFGFNRLADFHSNSLSATIHQGSSISDMFARQLTDAVIDNKYLNTDNYDAFKSYDPYLWAPIIGFQAWAVDSPEGKPFEYYSQLASGALLNQYLQRKTEGAIDEYTLSMAYNYEDILYVGATLGLQNLNYRKTDSYIELADEDSGPVVSDIDHNRQLHITGTGTNFKIGAIVRPVDWFRLGMSYHSPTWMTIEEESSQDMSVHYFDQPNKKQYADSPFLNTKYDTRTTGRLLMGASFTIADRAIISMDYKLSWPNQNSMRSTINEYSHRVEITSTDIDNDDAIVSNMNKKGDINFNNIIKDSYSQVNNYSVGVEGHLGSGFFARAGFMYQDSPYKDNNLKDYGKVYQGSVGLGFRTRTLSLDLTYVNSRTENLPYRFYSYYGGDKIGYIEPAAMISTKQVVDNVILSVGFRF